MERTSQLKSARSTKKERGFFDLNPKDRETLKSLCSRVYCADCNLTRLSQSFSWQLSFIVYCLYYKYANACEYLILWEILKIVCP